MTLVGNNDTSVGTALCDTGYSVSGWKLMSVTLYMKLGYSLRDNKCCEILYIFSNTHFYEQWNYCAGACTVPAYHSVAQIVKKKGESINV